MNFPRRDFGICLIFLTVLTCFVEISCDVSEEQEIRNPTQTSIDSGKWPALFTQEIFQAYGENSSISWTKFKELLELLHIGKKYFYVDGKLVEDKDHRILELIDVVEEDIFEPSTVVTASEQKPGLENATTHASNIVPDKCLSDSELYAVTGLKPNQQLLIKHFFNLCPTLIQQQVSGKCVHHHHGDKIHYDSDHDHDDEEAIEATEASATDLKVWGYGLLSITIISLTSLMAIAIIPFLGKTFYNKLMACLVALAIGTLSGDAMLHLIPHSLISHDKSGEKEREDHLSTVWRASMVMVGIYVFFLVECVMKIKIARKSHKKKVLHDHSRHIRSNLSSPSIGSRLAGLHHFSSQENMQSPCTTSFGISDSSTTKEVHELSDLSIPPDNKLTSGESLSFLSAKSMDESVQCCSQMNSSEHDNKLQHQDSFAFSDKELSDYKYRIVSDNLSKQDINQNVFGSLPGSDELQMYMNQCDFQFGDHGNVSNAGHCDDGHGDACSESHGKHHSDDADHVHTLQEEANSHQHGHSHDISKETSITSVAWMVVVGDGFHNLSDGLALGAAFSSSLTNGLTTSIAVFCHELPHELGDFAVLIKNGMTIKQAIAYNIASAVVSYLGLIMGIALGQIEGAKVWILAFTAGLFLYIALVDLLPELSSQLTQGAGLGVFLFQNIGFLLGIGIMMIIALYEEELSKLG